MVGKFLFKVALAVFATVDFVSDRGFTGDQNQAERKTVALFVEDVTPVRGCEAYLPALNSKLQAVVNRLGLRGVKPQGSVGKRLSFNSASVLQIARGIGSDFYLIGTISELSESEIARDVFEIGMEVDVNLNQTTLNAGEYGDRVSASVRKTSAEWPKNRAAVIGSLLNACVEKAADSIGRGMKNASALKDNRVQVKFNVSMEKLSGVCYDAVDGDGNGKARQISALISVGGNVVGNTRDKILMEKGLHEILIEYPLCRSYAKQVKVVQNQEFDILLELSGDGIDKSKKAEVFSLAGKSARRIMERKESIEDAMSKARMESVDLAGKTERDTFLRSEKVENAKADEQASRSRVEEALSKTQIAFLQSESEAIFKQWVELLKNEGSGRAREEEVVKIWIDVLSNKMGGSQRLMSKQSEKELLPFLSEECWLAVIKKIDAGEVDSDASSNSGGQ